MSSDPLYRRPLTWAGLRHAQSLRDALVWTLGGEVRSTTELLTVSEWLERQGLRLPNGATPEMHAVTLISLALTCAQGEMLGPAFLQAAHLGTRTYGEGWADIGYSRSGAGWADPAAFCITSAFVRLHGALEQFELDVLKVLFYYRPGGGQPSESELGERPIEPPEQEIIAVISEVPQIRDQTEFYEKPAVWTAIKPWVLDWSKRKALMSRVYRIEVIPEPAKENNAKRKDWQEKRNSIVHGRERVELSLGEYAAVDAFVSKAMLHIASQCAEVQGISI